MEASFNDLFNMSHALILLSLIYARHDDVTAQKQKHQDFKYLPSPFHQYGPADCHTTLAHLEVTHFAFLITFTGILSTPA